MSNFIEEMKDFTSEIKTEKKECPICKKPYKFFTISGLKNNAMLVPDCNCQEKREIQKEQGLRLRGRIKGLRDCGIGKRFMGKNFFNYDKGLNLKAFNICIDYARHIRDNLSSGTGLFLYGGVGTGKTHLSVSIIDYIARMKKRELITFNIIFTTSVNLLADIRQGYEKNGSGGRAGDKYEKCDLLVIDDLGTEKVTEWVFEMFYKIIDTRYSEMRPVIITTNYSIEEIRQKLSERFISRILEMCKGTKLEGEDYRVRSLKSKKKENR